MLKQINNKSQQTLIIQSLLSRINNNSTNTGTRVTEWSDTPLDTNYPSEKLVKDTIDNLDLTGGGDITKLYNESESNKTFYIDYTSGSDDNDGLTTSTAFKTITRVWNEIPIFFSSIYNIKIIGDYNNTETEVLKSRIGLKNNSQILITSNDTNNLSKITNRIAFVNVSITGYGTSTIYPGLFIKNLNFVGNGVSFFGCKEPYVSTCTFDGSTTSTNFVYSYNSNVTVTKSTFTGLSTDTESPLIYVTRHSSVYTYNNTFNTCKIGIGGYINSNISSISNTFNNVSSETIKDSSSTIIVA